MKKLLTFFLTAACTTLLVAGCSAPASNGEQPSQGDTPSTVQEGDASGQETRTAMYVPFGVSSYILVDQENGTVFTVTMPAELYGLSGDRIVPEDLQAGNLLEITGNGIMLESYPGQYPDVTMMRVVSEGTPEDADQYQDIVDAIYTEPDPAQPPSMSVEYRTSLAVVNAAADRGSYEWSYPDDGGETQHVVACGAHILQWEWEQDSGLKLTEPADLILHFSPTPPAEVRVHRWPADQQGTEDAAVLDGGETVPVQLRDGKWVIEGAEAGYIYRVIGTWGTDEVEFGFQTK